MMLGTSSVTSKGQVTIPKEMRDKLGIESGWKVEMTLENDTIQLRPASDEISSLRGALAIPGENIDYDKKEARAAMEKAAINRFLKTRRP